MSGLQTLKVGYGTVNLAARNLKLNTVRVRDGWLRDPAATCGQRTYGTQTSSNVGPHGDLNGKLYGEQSGHPNGTVIMVTGSLSSRGAPLSDGAVLLRLRAEAALLQVMAKLPRGTDNYFGERFTMFEGRADILSVDEARVLGVQVPNGFAAKFFAPDQVDERFDILELQPEVQARPQIGIITAPDGSAVVKELAAEPTRRIRVRGR